MDIKLELDGHENKRGTADLFIVNISNMKLLLSGNDFLVLDDMDNYGGCLLVVKSEKHPKKYFIHFYPEKTTALHAAERFQKFGTPYMSKKSIDSEFNFHKIH